jgi:hypothetical protein
VKITDAQLFNEWDAEKESDLHTGSVYRNMLKKPLRTAESGCSSSCGFGLVANMPLS